MQRTAQAIRRTEFVTAQFGIASAFLAIGFSLFLDVVNPLATAGKRKGDAVVGLVRYLGAGAASEAKTDEQGRQQGAELAVHGSLVKQS